MAFSDPQTVTINAIANTLPRINSPINGAGVFQKDDANVKLTISTATGKRVRQSARLDFRKIAADPLISAQNIMFSMSAFLVVDTPITGFTIAEKKQIVDAITLWATTGAGANITKLLGAEV